MRQKMAAAMAANNRSQINKDALETFVPMPGGQSEFVGRIKKGDRFVGCHLRGGIGSGKSRTGAWYCCYRAKIDPDGRGLITANEYGQLETSTLVALAEFCLDYNIPLHPTGDSPEETAKMIAMRRLCTIFKARFLVVSANKFDGGSEKAKQGARGIEIKTAWMDEWCYASEMAFETLLGRIGRGKGKLPGQFVITSSINRNHPFNWVYDKFADPERSDELKQMYQSICCLTSDNKSLDPVYLKTLEASYTPELAALELRGEYVATTIGRIFKYFNRKLHTDGGIGVSPGKPIHLSFDFNHSPATAIATQVFENTISIIREWYLENSNTFELAEEVLAWIQSQSMIYTLYIHGDASGNQMTANSKVSNWGIVTKYLKTMDIQWYQRWKTKNPSVIDSINSVNSLFHNERILVHPSCKELIKDLESLRFDDKGKVDKSDIKRSHLADCLRYLCYDLYPIPSGGQWGIIPFTWKRI
ncbi:MAG: hypothetical protein F6K50_02600 [Moorea sp. SIO3I7]|nr:hypothetical protein [Moorena sp. SIO3I7]